MPRRANRLAELIKFDPRRSPRWRYERIRQLLDARPHPRQPVRGQDDEHVREGRRFILAWEELGRQIRSRDPMVLRDARKQLYPMNPELYFAFDMFVAADAERNRNEMEARILAKQTNEKIAEEMVGLPGTVDWYERLFFNVRDRLHNRGYIVNRVICPSILDGGWQNLNLEMSTKFFGYFAGPIILDAVLHQYDQGTAIPSAATDISDPFFDSHFGSQIKRRSAEASNHFEINKYNVMELFEIHGKLIELTKKAKEENEQLSTIEQNVQVTLQGINFCAGERRQAALASSPLKPYYGQTGELRSHEMLAIAGGDSSSVDVEQLQCKTLPIASVSTNEQPAEQGIRE